MRPLHLTVCISYLALVLETSSDGDAADHEYPVNIRTIDLSKELLGSMNNFNTWETSMRDSLLDYRISP